MGMKMKLVSVNIEGSKHLDTVGDFLVREHPDIVCLQEVRGEDISQLVGDSYPHHEFAPNDVLGNIAGLEGKDPTGVAILSRMPLSNTQKIYLGSGPRDDIVPPKAGSHPPVLLKTQVGKIILATIHFTWTPDGRVSDEQRRDLNKLLTSLEGAEMVLCGDFNISRGNELYAALTQRYKDNIPQQIVTTVDPKLHYANREKEGALQTVVDYVFSTPKYIVSEVRVVSGVSDHYGIVFNLN